MPTAHRPPIEVEARRHPPLGMPAARFLRTYWQKHPLLVRGAFPGFVSPLSPDDLAGLACEPVVNARLVHHRPRGDRWTVRHGPFDAADFARLPARDWTLLVQDCDKLLAEVEPLLDPFAFLPAWRLDDVMVSYAADRGSVGAHVDQYDVFLLQGAGRRRWSIDVDPRAPRDFRDGVELKLLRRFDPSHTWLLEPGDMLYLPPGVPHLGVADGPCMTYSVGLRAPSAAELLVDRAEWLAEDLPEALRYADPDLRAPARPGEIDARAFARVEALLARAQALDPAARRAGFARFITRYRSAGGVAPREAPLTAGALQRRLARRAMLRRNPWSRYAWYREGRGARAWFAGEPYACSPALAATLAGAREYHARELRGLGAADRAALLAMINAGHLHFSDD